MVIWRQTYGKEPFRAREESRCRHIGYSFRLTARFFLYAQSHRQDCTYHSLCYTSRGALAGTRNSSMGPPHEGSIQRPIAPWANTLITELHLAPHWICVCITTKASYKPIWVHRLLPIPVGLLVLPCTRQWRRPSLFFLVQDRGTSWDQYLCLWQVCATTACSECAC